MVRDTQKVFANLVLNYFAICVVRLIVSMLPISSGRSLVICVAQYAVIHVTHPCQGLHCQGIHNPIGNKCVVNMYRNHASQN